MALFNNKNRVDIATRLLETQEFLSRDILDEHYVKIYEPYRLIQMVLGTCRVDIRHRFATAPSVLQKCYTILWLILIPYTTVELMQVFAKRNIDRTMNSIWIGGLSGLITIYTVSIFHTRFLNNELNVRLHIKMHEINRIMMMKDNKINNIQYKINLVSAVSLVVGFICLITASMLLTGIDYKIHQISIPACSVATFIIELSSTCNYIAYFTTRVRLINGMITNHLKGRSTVNIQCEPGWMSKYFEETAAEWQDFQSSQVDVYLKQILLGFAEFQTVYSFQILLFFIAFVGWIFVTIEYLILALQKYSDLRSLNVDFMQLIFVAVLKLSLLLNLCIRGELFTRSIKKTKSLSIAVILRYSDGPLYRTAMKMIEMIDDTKASFCVYGMWEVNARFLLRMFQVMTSWLVTLLQFAFV